jgi:polysaccharide biosynthesis transport protein
MRKLSPPISAAPSQKTASEFLMRREDEPVVSIDIHDCWRAVRARKALVLLFAFCGLLAAIAVNLIQTPIYRARLRLEILEPNENFLNRQQLDGSVTLGNMRSETYVETQMKILQSDTLAKNVIQQIDFDRRIAHDHQQSWIASVLPGGNRNGSRVLTDADGLKTFTSNLTVAPVGDTRIIEILYDSPDPQLSADVANALAAEFIKRGWESQAKSARTTAQWLAQSLEDLHSQLNKSEQDLKQFANRSELLFASDATTVAVERLKSLQQEISKAQADLAVKDSRRQLVSVAPAESLPDVLGDPMVREMDMKLADLRRQYAELSVSFTPDFYKVKRIKAQIDETAAAYQAAKDKILQRIQDEAQEAKFRESRLLTEYDVQSGSALSLASKQLQYDSLKREAEAKRALYMATLQKVTEATIASTTRVENAEVLDSASAPVSPFRPRRLANSAAITLPFTLLGVIVALYRERSGRRFRQPTDTQEYLNIEVLGAIAAAAGASASKPGTAVDSHSIESIRGSFLAMLQSRSQQPTPRVFVISSPQAAEGKTTVVTQLGIGLSEIGKKVLLIDGDLRRPRLHTIFGLPNERGLSDLVRKEQPSGRLFAGEPVSHDGLIQSTRFPGLFVMSSGPNGLPASAILSAPRLSTVLRTVRRHFDLIFIDTPPGAGFVDARVFARSADGVILVFRADRTAVRDGQLAALQFTRDGASVVGAILNDWKPTRNGYERHYY